AYQTLIDESISGGLDPSKPESFRRLAESVKPSLSIVPEFMDGMREDLRPALNAEQMRLMDERCKKAHDWYEQRQHMMDRWAKGDVRPDEEWFRAFGDDDLSGELNNSSDGSRSRVSRDMQWAKRRSENPLFDCDPKFWGQFLVDAKQTFGMSAAQFNAGQEILKSYREKAEAIMTYEWRQQVQRNRYKSYVQNVNVGEPTGPYLYAVEREYRQLTRPLLEIKRAFHRDVIALTTYEQRTKVLEGLQKYGMSHGMTGDELSLPAMSLMSIPVATTSQPATSAP
ncbi:MAG: hypothetical protein FWC56_06235, partial [Phycisphaerae bacterium]|nr:hypothetical protein [Phycisphaerae bacterium]